MPVTEDQFALCTDDSGWMLQADGTWALGDCCVECATCDLESFASSYAVAFEDDVDFWYEDTGSLDAHINDGQSCGPLATSPETYKTLLETLAPGYPHIEDWDYTLDQDEASSCEPSVPYSDQLILYQQANGAYIRIYPTPPSDAGSLLCRWFLFVFFSVCVHTNDLYYKYWAVATCEYHKMGGDTPAGTSYPRASPYFFGSFTSGWTDITKLTYPASITLS
jgi:hypothetical protein